MIPIPFGWLDVAFFAYFLIELVKPSVQVFIVEKVKMLILSFELYLCDFGIGDVWFRRRRQSYLIYNITKYLSDFLFQNLFLDIPMEFTPFILPLIKDKCLSA